MEYFISSPNWLDAANPPHKRDLKALSQSVQALLPQHSVRTEPFAKGVGLRFEFQLLYCTREARVCAFRFTNTGDKVIQRICFSGNCKAFEKADPPIEFEKSVNLGPGGATENRNCDLDLIQNSGNYALDFSGSFLDEQDLWHAFQGSFTLSVCSQADSVSLSEHNRVKWIEVPLEEDPDKTYLLRKKQEASKRPKVTMPKAEPLFHVTANVALISFSDTKSDRMIWVWTGKNCTIGKASDNDLTCVFLPDNAENKEKNKLISRKHCSLEIQTNRVILKDLKSTNGTFINNLRISSPLTLRNGQMISLSDKLFLRYLDFRSLDESREVRKAMSSCTTALDCTTALAKLSLKKSRNSAPLEAFLLRRQNNYSDKLEYLFLMRSAILGSSSNYAAIYVQHDSVCDQHARLIFHSHQYFIEALQSNSETWVDDKPLKPYVPIALGPESRIRVGDVEIGFNIPIA